MVSFLEDPDGCLCRPYKCIRQIFLLLCLFHSKSFKVPESSGFIDLYLLI